MLSVYLLAVWDVLLELAPWLFVGAVVAGILHGIVPPDLIKRHLSGRGGVLKAVVLGVPLPLCSCGVIPAGIGLKKDGASDGAAIGFLTATPQTGVDSILVSASFLGWPFALAKVGAALATGITSGLITELVSPQPAHPPTPLRAPSGEGGGGRSGPVWREMVEHGVDLVRMIWGWLVFGVLLSAALTTFLPAGVLGGWAGVGLGAAFAVALVVSLPLYVCATASVPIAAALVAAGMPTGAAMVFLMAGPATNVATLGAVYRSFGARVVGVYLATIVAGSVAFGLLYETMMGQVTVSAVGTHTHAAWWAQLAAAALVAMMVWFAGEEVQGWLARRRAAAAQARQLTVGVEGMTCGGCASRLERTLRALDGVEAVSISLEDKQATVSGPVSADAVREAVQRAGFDAVA